MRTAFKRPTTGAYPGTLSGGAHSPSRPGRKPTPTRKVLEAVLWILNTGARCHMLPQCYPNCKTVHRRFQTWCRNDVLREVMTDLANTLRDEVVLDESECLIDATFASAKGGGVGIGPARRRKSVKITAILGRHGLPQDAARDGWHQGVQCCVNGSDENPLAQPRLARACTH